MHAEPVERKLIRATQPREQVVGVQHRRRRHLPERWAVRADVGVGAHEHPERPAEPTHLADRLRPVVVKPEGVAVADDRRHGQELLEDVAHRDRAAAGPAAVVRLRERLVQIEVYDVEPEVAGPRDSANRVQIRAVVVHQRACAVEDPRDLFDSLVEEPERRWVRQHQARRARADLRAQLLEVDVAAAIGADVDELVTGHRDAGRIRAVSAVGDHDLAPLLGFAAIGEVGAHQHQPRQLPLRTGGRLERHGGQPGDLGEDLLEPPHQLQRPLRGLLFLVRMKVAEARQAGDALVDARVVLHRARAQWVEAGVDAERPVGQRREVADELRLRDLRQARRARAAQLLGDVGRGKVGARERRRATARLRLLVDQLHAASASTRRSISSVVRFSVTATSSASSSPW